MIQKWISFVFMMDIFMFYETQLFHPFSVKTYMYHAGTAARRLREDHADFAQK